MNLPLSVELKELHIIVLISFTKNIQKNHSQVFTRFITDLLPPYFYILASALKAAIAIERDHLFQVCVRNTQMMKFCHCKIDKLTIIYN